ncbi:MAG: hypothetical protein P8144_15110, partial [Gammaproteobacteria bacterium]
RKRENCTSGEVAGAPGNGRSYTEMVLCSKLNLSQCKTGIASPVSLAVPIISRSFFITGLLLWLHPKVSRKRRLPALVECH